eukprot:7353068-Alexandrium_andersonii.AAC.1
MRLPAWRRLGRRFPARGLLAVRFVRAWPASGVCPGGVAVVGGGCRLPFRGPTLASALSTLLGAKCLEMAHAG